MDRYREEYKEYYDKIRKKIKGKPDKQERIISTRDDIYPNVRNVHNFSYQRGSYGAATPKKSMGYIDKFILRLICTFLLLLGVFTLKTIPNSNAKELYNICKTTVGTNFNYDNILLSMDKMGIDYKSVFNIIEEKYTDVMSEIKNLDKEVPSFKEEGAKTNIDKSGDSRDMQNKEDLLEANDKLSIDKDTNTQEQDNIDESQSTLTEENITDNQ